MATRPWLLAALLIAWPLAGRAAELRVPAQPGALARAIAQAHAGDVLRLAPGKYLGAVILDRPLTIDGGGAAEVVGPATGSVITVTAPGAVVRGLIVSGSGSSHEKRDSGIRLAQSARGAVAADNHLIGNLYGIDIHGAPDARVIDNVIEGRRDHRVNSRGNGVYVWNAPGAQVIGNDIHWGRDGIFVNTSKHNLFRDNRMRDLRFAIHYMYANDSEISGNVSINNNLGYALMYSTHMRAIGNASLGDRDYGIMLNYANYSDISGNLVRGGPEKCLFFYNSNYNRVSDNTFEHCGIGIHFTAGSEGNGISGNAFIGNRTQVKYVGSRWLDWSAEGRGNYWSDFAAYDLNGDGMADSPFRPNDAMDHILWTQPAAKLLIGSPAVQLIHWAQSAFPALLPGGVIDSHALMTAPPALDINWKLHHDE